MKISRTFALFFLMSVFVLSGISQAQSGRVTGSILFTNEGSPKYNWVARGIEDILFNKLSGLRGVSVYEGETLARVLKKTNTRNSADVDGKRAFSIGKETGIEILVVGKYSVDENQQLTIETQMVSTYTGSPIFTEPFTGAFSDLFSYFEGTILKGLEIMRIPVSNAEKAFLAEQPTNSMDAYESFCKAYLEIDKESPLEIIAGYFQRALRTDPNFWEAQYNLGVIYYNFRLYDKAMRQFDAVLETNPNIYKPYFGKGVIYFLQKQYDKSLHELSRSLALKPNHDRSYFYQGIVYTKVDSLKKGIQSLERAIDINPNYAPTHYQLGQAEMQRGWFKKAITSLIQATRLDPDYHLAHNALGEAYYALNSFEEAIIEFKKAISLKGNFATAYFNLANSIYRRGALAEIVDSFWALLETQYLADASGTNGSAALQDSPLAGLEELREKSRIEDTSQILKEMIGAYRTALRYDVRFYEASYNLALTYENLGDADSALYFYKKAIEQREDLSQAHMRLGKIYEAQRKYDLALKSFKRAVEISPDYFVANPKLGEPYRYVNIIEEVLNDNIERLERNQRDAQALEVVGKIYLSLGRFGQAEQYYEQLVQVSPNHAMAQQKLREIRR
nr:tetratricopeptide repeat protein [Calditrichia bacterium]